jgi:hypothetical protein
MHHNSFCFGLEERNKWEASHFYFIHNNKNCCDALLSHQGPCLGLFLVRASSSELQVVA